MMEIGLLSVTVLILAVAIYLVRKSKKFLPSGENENGVNGANPESIGVIEL